MKVILSMLFVLLTMSACATTAPTASTAPPTNTETSDEHHSDDGHSNVAEIGAHIELKGTPEAVRAMMTGLENEAIFNVANCVKSPANPTGETQEIHCTKAENALLAALNRHVRPGVVYTVSATSCALPCKVIRCPPPTGAIMCCTGTSPYKYCAPTKK